MSQRPLLDLAERPLDCDVTTLLSDHLFGTGEDCSVALSSTPVLMSAQYVDRLRTLSPLLEAAFRAVVRHYFEDVRIRAIYDLDPTLQHILQLARARPYAVGFYRPDFVYDLDGQPRICEIGARYTMNGWMISHQAAIGLAGSLARASLRAMPRLDDLFASLHAMHPSGCTVAMVHAREAGTELFYLREALRARGVEFVQAHPSELECEGDDILLRGQRIDRLILEMDRTELPLLRKTVLALMIKYHNYFNDVRTLILVHDKRVLAVLSDAAIMRDCMDGAAYAELQRYLIPTWAVTSASDVAALRKSAVTLIAKPSSGGRGVGTWLRDHCDADTWATLVNSRRRDYVFQEYLAQREFLDPDSGAAMHLVGMQLCHDQHSYGPGIFRGSDELVINLHQGRGRIFAGAVL